MKDLDNLAVALILGGIAGAAFFIAPPTSNSDLIHIIVGGLLGFLAKAALQSPPQA